MDKMPEQDAMEATPGNGIDGLDPAELLRQGAAGDTVPGNVPGGFAPPTPEELATFFPRFEILGLIGKGGMGAVYKVRQPELDRIVALKILPPSMELSPAFPERFTREAKAMARLNHTGIVTIHEFGQQGDLYYFLMEYVDGVNLRQLLENGRISPREAMAIVPQICDALQFAHDQGIVHRDIKPENILLDRLGRVKVADFGIAKLVGSADFSPQPTGHGTTFTEHGKIIGTPQYMAPEQSSCPSEVDHRADIFALGVVFYQMLTGELPEKNLQPPSRKISLDVRLDEVVLRALEKDPQLRYSNATEMKTRIEDLNSPQLAHRIPWNLNYRSERKIFGLPLVNIVSGIDPKTGKERVARGVVAIGGKARGFLAIGGMTYGVFAFGGIAVGLFAFGGVAVGAVSWGGVALALVLALGGLAVGYSALGGTAIGYFSYGSSPHGVHTLGPKNGDAAAKEFFLPWANDLLANVGPILLLVMAFVFLVAFGTPLWLAQRQPQPDSRKPSPWIRHLFRSTKANVFLAIAILIAITLGFLVFGLKQSADATEPLLNFEKRLLELEPKLEGMGWADELDKRTGKHSGIIWSGNGNTPEETSSWPKLIRPGHSDLEITDRIEDTRSLCTWFSHPLIDGESIQKVTFINPQTNLPLTSSGHATGNTPAKAENNGETGWMTYIARLEKEQYLLNDLIVSLRYSIGSWETVGEIAFPFEKSVSLTDGAIISPPGNTPEGNAHIDIISDQDLADFRNQIRIRAVAKNGKIFESQGFSAHSDGMVYTKRLSFPLRLSEIEKFTYSKRPIRETRFHVVLIQSQQEQVLHTYIENLVLLRIAKRASNESDLTYDSAKENLAIFLAKHAEFPNLQSDKLLAQKAAKAKQALEDSPGTMLSKQMRTTNPRKFRAAQLRLFALESLMRESGVTVASEDLAPDNRLEIRSVSPDNPAAKLMRLETTDPHGEKSIQEVNVSSEVIVWDKHVTATAIGQADGFFELGITLDETGTERLRKATLPGEKQIRLAIMVDGKIFSAPVVVNAPLGENFTISGFGKAHAIDLLKSLPGSASPLQTIVAIDWLTEADAGNYGKSYDLASEFFKNSLSREEWIDALGKFRTPLGNGISRRSFRNLHESMMLPGSPDGEYLVIQFRADFPEKQNVIETITFMKEKDGVWRMAGYFIK